MNTPDSVTVQRHAGIDRLFHWLTALTMMVLMGTSLLPVLGIRFAWVRWHWMAGVLLTVVILLHIVRALFAQSPRAMRLRRADLAELSGALPGKYSLQQKLIHLAWSVAILLAIGTGVVLMVKSGTPFFVRDPYILSLRSWGVLTLLHDLAAFATVFLILVHVYFGLLPEKRLYLRSMVLGWVTRDELRANHDPQRIARGE
jgi:cytochrome b subunit of formate dehydrogenase